MDNFTWIGNVEGRVNVLYPSVNQEADVCWAISLIRQLTAILRSKKILKEDKPLSIQHLINGVPSTHYNKRGAIKHPLLARSFLVEEGSVMETLCPLTYRLDSPVQRFDDTIQKYKILDLICHHKENSPNYDAYEAMVAGLLRVTPLTCAIPVHDSYVRFRGQGLYYPAADERKRRPKYGFHCMVLVGQGVDEHGMHYWVCQESKGTHWGDGGYVRLAKQQETIWEVFEMVISPQ